MRTPIRKPGKYTWVKTDPYITKEKYNKLKNSLTRLLKIERPLAITDVKEQAAFGDFSENAAYSIAKSNLRSINNRILKIEDHLKNAIIINVGTEQCSVRSDTVQIGNTVTIESNSKTKTYQILGSAEVDIAKNIISHNSPLGASLMGKRVGEIIRVKDKEIKLIAIN